jgi:hypothetical protein
VRIRPRRSNEVVVADELSNPRPRHPTQMKLGDAAVA